MEGGKSSETLYHVPIIERYRLNHDASQKETYHIALNLKGLGLEYSVGDCVGVYPTNHPETVELLLSLVQATGDEEILDRNGQRFSLKHFLQHRANLSRVQRKLVELLKEKLGPEDRTKAPFNLLEPDGKEALRAFLETAELPLFLAEFAKNKLTCQELVSHLSPLIPRLYSIASSMKSVGEEVHLTVALTQYEKEGYKLYGTCSYYLCHLAPLHLNLIPIYFQRAKDFTLAPSMEEKPLIMVGPGTGIAPFRGFMQERMHGKSSKNWLFFGERNHDYDFYYRDFWKKLEAAGHLRLDVAFSRDQPEKIYVQHKMFENAREIWRWLEEGAFFLVCGDASKMAKDVDSALHKIVELEGSMSADDAKNYIKNLRKEKRYLRDVY